MASHDINNVFRKNDDGSWTCIAATFVSSPLVKVSIEPGIMFTPGKLFVGIDIARKLDESTSPK